LKETPEYKKKSYVEALDRTFQKIDELIDSEEGAEKLKELRKTINKGAENSNSNNANAKVGNGTGCTANVVLITEDKYIIANAGDSRSALCRDGSLVVFS
jgi:serine/threonine protein phosphatase PrpC